MAAPEQGCTSLFSPKKLSEICRSAFHPFADPPRLETQTPQNQQPDFSIHQFKKTSSGYARPSRSSRIRPAFFPDSSVLF
jgi:hypothetical protein